METFKLEYPVGAALPVFKGWLADAAGDTGHS